MLVMGVTAAIAGGVNGNAPFLWIGISLILLAVGMCGVGLLLLWSSRRGSSMKRSRSDTALNSAVAEESEVVTEVSGRSEP